MFHRPSPRRRWLAAAAVGLVVVIAGVALVVEPRAGGATDAANGIASGAVAAGTSSASPTIWIGSPSALPTIDPTASLTPSPTASPSWSGFQPINLFVIPTPAPAHGAQPTDPSYAHDSRRPLPEQSGLWLQLKAAGRIALVDGKVVVLDIGADPLVNPTTGQPVPAARTLDVAWTRWVVEPYAYGRDVKGNRYSDLNFWNLCGPGATAAALWYWQQLTGYPDVAGTAGYFLDPYAAEGVSWPVPGPTVAKSGGTRIGTYWSGSDSLNGFTAHGRGYIMYLAMVAQPPTWQSPGMAVFANGNGAPLYPTRGSSRANIQTVMNWEISNHTGDDWFEAWYASILRPDAMLAQDLRTAVMLDVGRDGVPVIAAVDTYDLPNWQAGSATPHTRHAVAIVGYNNKANPPTYTYIDTCGRSCNHRAGNSSGQIHVISQTAMVKAIQDRVGSGVTW